MLPINNLQAHNSAQDNILGPPLTPGTILATNSFVDAVYPINPNTHNVLLLSGGTGSSQFPIVGSGIRFNTPDDIVVLNLRTLIDSDSSLKALINVDLETGDRTLFSIFPLNNGPAFQFPTQMTVDQTTGAIYLTDPIANAIFSVDATTGDRSIIVDNTMGSGPLFGRVSGITFGKTGKLIVAGFNIEV